MDVNRTHIRNQEKERFRLVKFFAWASLIVIIVFSFPFSVVISQKAKNMLIRSYENYAMLLGKNLNYQVFQYFVIPVYRRYGEIKLRRQEQYELMDRVVKNTIHGFNIDLVNIYDIRNGVVAYSTNPSLIGNPVSETPGYKKAKKGELSSGIISTGGGFFGIDFEFIGGIPKLRTYIPFRVDNPYTGEKGYVAGVFELVQDMSEQYRSIVRFQYLVFGLSILIMGLIFVALILIVQKAENLIQQRMEEQRKLESQLHHAERLAILGEMVARVSHEIKNPLGIIQSTAELLGSTSKENDPARKLSGIIKEESIRLNRIVTEFLDFARPMVPRFEQTDLREIIERNIQFLAPEFEKKSIQVENSLPHEPIMIMADREQLYRAFMNILMNAIQALDNNGKIKIKIEKSKDSFKVIFEDNGPGISKEHMDKIFNPFFTTKDKGSGLGLAIVKKIIEGHNGTINIESVEGHGTKVIVNLPIRV